MRVKAKFAMKLNEQQKLFIIGKSILKELAETEKERALTAAEKERRDKVQTELFASVVRFGMSEARKRMSKYLLDSDAYAEIQQALAAIFFERLPMYDPTKATPTTYFVPYFNQEISQYLRSFSQHLTQYDAKNVAAVRQAIRYYEAKGIKWDEAMIATRTGLSTKVVKNTISIASNAKRANIEDTLYVKSKELTPEENYLKNEKSLAIMTALMESLDVDELEFFLFRENLDGEKELTYQAVADHYNIPVRDAKKKWSIIIAKLNNNKQLQEYYYKTSKNPEISLKLHDASGDIAEHQIVGYYKLSRESSDKSKEIQENNDTESNAEAMNEENTSSENNKKVTNDETSNNDN